MYTSLLFPIFVVFLQISISHFVRFGSVRSLVRSSSRSSLSAFVVKELHCNHSPSPPHRPHRLCYIIRKKGSSDGNSKNIILPGTAGWSETGARACLRGTVTKSRVESSQAGKSGERASRERERWRKWMKIIFESKTIFIFAFIQLPLSLLFLMMLSRGEVLWWKIT